MSNNSLDLITKNEINTLKEKEENKRLEEFREEEFKAKKELDKAIETIIEDKNSKFNEYFLPLINYIKSVINSDNYLNSLFVVGEGGLGKTTILLKTLKEMNKEYVYISNYTTIVEFVNFLYEHKDSIIVMDDMEGIFNLGAKFINILKGTLWGVGKENKRIVTYLTTDKRLKAPSQFEFKGKIFFLLNKMPNEKDSLIRALLSRSLVYELNLTYEEIMKMMGEFAKIEYKNLTFEERKMIYEFLKENTDDTCEDINFRTLVKMYDLYLTNKENWKSICKNLIKRNEKLALLKLYLKESNTIKEAQERFCEETGLCRKTFFNLKAKLTECKSVLHL